MRYYRREKQYVQEVINVILYERFQEIHQTKEWKQQNRLDEFYEEEYDLEYDWSW